VIKESIYTQKTHTPCREPGKVPTNIIFRVIDWGVKIKSILIFMFG
jgi:hypothetical protein